MRRAADPMSLLALFWRERTEVRVESTDDALTLALSRKAGEGIDICEAEIFDQGLPCCDYQSLITSNRAR